MNLSGLYAKLKGSLSALIEVRRLKKTRSVSSRLQDVRAMGEHLAEICELLDSR